MATARRRLTSALAGLGLLAGCHTVPLYGGSPFLDDPRPAPVKHYAVDWWVRLVPATIWEYEPREHATPAVDPATGHLIVLTRDGKIRSLTPRGQTEWEYVTHARFNAGATVVDGVVYVSGGDGTLYALSAKKGELIWKYDAKEDLATSPVIAGDKVLVASETDAVYAVDRKTGKWLWQYRRDVPAGFSIRGAARPTVSGDVALVGFSDGHLAALKLSDGSIQWERALSAAGQFTDSDASPVVDTASNRVFVSSYKDGLYALRLDSGDVIWQTTTAGTTSLLRAGDVVFASGDTQVAAFHADTGKLLWTLPLKGRAGRAPILAQGELIVPVTNSLMFVDPATGKPRVSWDPGQGVSATPLWARGHLYVLSNLGFLYAMDLPGRSG